MKDLKHIKRFNESEENLNISDVISSFSLSYTDEQLENELKNHTITIRVSDLFKAYKEGSIQAGINSRCGFERYDFMEWLKKNYS
jgi:hypothetical protein